MADEAVRNTVEGKFGQGKRPLHEMIDELAIYSRALSDAEIAGIAASGSNELPLNAGGSYARQLPVQ